MSIEARVIAKMTDDELGESSSRAAQNERKSMHTVLLHIKEVERRRYYAKVGRGSLFEYVTKDLKYSEGSANRRIAAARLLKDLPEIAESIQSGSLNLSNLVVLHSTIRAVEKKTHEKIDLREKRELVELIQDKTTENVVRELVELFPEAARPEKARMVAGRKTEVTVPFDEDEIKLFTRVRELESHKNDNFSWQELFVFLAKFYLQSEDPLLKPLQKKKQGKTTSALADTAAIAQGDKASKQKPLNDSQTTTQRFSKTAQDRCIEVADLEVDRISIHRFPNSERHSRYISVSAERALHHRSGSQCEHVDPETGERCRRKFHLQPDHIVPICNGGSSEFGNLQLLCRAHNLWKGASQVSSRKTQRMVICWQAAPYLRDLSCLRK